MKNGTTTACIKRLPNVLIIGVRKGGTSTLAQFLSLHSKIHKTDEDEVRYFVNPRLFIKGREWYREQMPCSCEGDVVIEKTPAYFHYAHVS